MKRFTKDHRGNLSIMIAVGAAVLIGGVGGSVDYSIYNQQRTAMQAAADASALASAYELGLASTNKDDVITVAEQYVTLNFTKNQILSSEEAEDLNIDVEIDNNRRWVTVDITYTWYPFFAHLISDFITPIKVSATASLAGEQSVCVIALDASNDSALLMSGASSITASDCGVYSNSTSSSGINSNHQNAFLESASTFTSGGFTGLPSNFSPEPISDSPPIQDPLKERGYPPIASCKAKNRDLQFPLRGNKKDSRLQDGVLTLEEGTYCDGLRVTGKIEVNFKPGVYVFKDGPLEILGNATISGENVGFFFTGDDATFTFTGSSQVKLTAPDEGLMAGLLFFEDRDSPTNREFRIETRDAELFEGTVYLPRGRFVIDKASRLGQQSNWTAIIAHQIETGNGPELEINSDFSASTIPVPEGIAPSSGQPILTGPQS